ncbi:MAG: CBS domain-containing protein [Ectothiorhodospiraceae bacterium]|nr:CBS domain-containing protein [Ectothiorhodospiraceae bacterium]
MTPFPYSIETDATLAEAQAMMTDHAVRHLPVAISHVPVGMLSQRDLAAALAAGAGAGGRLVRDVCTTDAYVVDLETRLDVVLSEMAERHIGSAIVTRHGKLAGVFTATDACRAFAEHLRATYPSPDDDAA